MPRYANDPRWITARFPSTCKKCGCSIKKDAEVFYYPKNKEAFCESCGKPMSDEFNACSQDEAVYNGGGW